MRKRSFLIYGLPFIYFILTYFLFGFYYNTNDDPAIELILRGLASDTPEMAIGPYLIGLSRVCSLLYSLIPSLPWFGIILYFFLLVSLSLIHRILWESFPKLRNPIFFIGISLLYFALAFIDHLILFNFTRVSILLAGSALICFLDPDLQNKRFKRSLFLVLFLIAYGIRPEAATITALVVAVFSLVIAGFKASDRKYYLRNALFIAGSTLVLMLVPSLFQDEEAKQFRERFKLIANYSAYKYERPDWIKSERDQQIKNSLNYYFYADRELFAPDSLKRITLGSAFNFSRLEGTGWKRIGNFYDQLDQSAQDLKNFFMPAHGPAYFILLGILCLLLINDLFRYKGGVSVGLLLFYLFIWLLLLLVLYFLKMHDRIVSPLLSLALPFGWWYIKSFNLKLKLYFPILILFGACTAYKTIDYRDYIRHEVRIASENQKWAQKAWKGIDSHYGDSRIINSISSYYLLVDQNPFNPPISKGREAFILIDGWTSLLPYLYDHLEEISEKKNFSEFFQYMSEQDFLMLADPSNAKLISAHFHVLYGRDLQFYPRSLHNPYLDAYGLRLYTFELK